MYVVHVLTILDPLLSIPPGLLVGGGDCRFSTQIQDRNICFFMSEL